MAPTQQIGRQPDGSFQPIRTIIMVTDGEVLQLLH
jgi:hypothetical protein